MLLGMRPHLAAGAARDDSGGTEDCALRPGPSPPWRSAPCCCSWPPRCSNRRAAHTRSTRRLDEVNARYHDVEGKLRRLRSDVNLSGIFVRDYLLDPDRERAPHYRQRIADFRRQNRAAFDELRQLAGMDAATSQQLPRLGTQLEEYWQTLDPLFDWTRRRKLSESARFLREEVIPRREAVLGIATRSRT